MGDNEESSRNDSFSEASSINDENEVTAIPTPFATGLDALVAAAAVVAAAGPSSDTNSAVGSLSDTATVAPSRYASVRLRHSSSARAIPASSATEDEQVEDEQQDDEYDDEPEVQSSFKTVCNNTFLTHFFALNIHNNKTKY